MGIGRKREVICDGVDILVFKLLLFFVKGIVNKMLDFFYYFFFILIWVG